jgi:hypothetical protein
VNRTRLRHRGFLVWQELYSEILVIGTRTLVVGLIAGLAAASVALSLLPGPPAHVFDSRTALAFALTMVFAVIALDQEPIH